MELSLTSNFKAMNKKYIKPISDYKKGELTHYYDVTPSSWSPIIDGVEYVGVEFEAADNDPRIKELEANGWIEYSE